MGKGISSSLGLPLLYLVTAATVSTVAAGGPLVEQSVPLSQGVLFSQPLLSEAEQADYRARLRSTNDEVEQERIRSAHYELMKARAKARGYALPESRPATTGIKGGAFSPTLVTEEERAAQRARVRARGKQSGTALAPARSESALGIAQPARQGQTVTKPSGAEQPYLDAKTMPSQSANAVIVPHAAAPNTPPAEPSLAATVLPTIDMIFGPQLMTEEERSAYRARLRRASSDEQRQAIRAERDQQLRLRAQDKGVPAPR